MTDEQCLEHLENWAHTDVGPDKGVMMSARFVVAAYRRLTKERDEARNEATINYSILEQHRETIRELVDALRPFAEDGGIEHLGPTYSAWIRKARALVGKYGKSST